MGGAVRGPAGRAHLVHDAALAPADNGHRAARLRQPQRDPVPNPARAPHDHGVLRAQRQLGVPRPRGGERGHSGALRAEGEDRGGEGGGEGEEEEGADDEGADDAKARMTRRREGALGGERDTQRLKESEEIEKRSSSYK